MLYKKHDQLRGITYSGYRHFGYLNCYKHKLNVKLRLEWWKNQTKIKTKRTRYRLTHGIPWSVYSCRTGQLLFSPKQQFNDIDNAVVTLFAFVVFCHFKKPNFSYPHSSTIISRVTVIFFLSFIHTKFSWKLEISYLGPDWYDFLIWFVWFLVLFLLISSQMRMSFGVMLRA